MNHTELQQLIWNEFASQYLPEELPSQWDESFLAKDLPEMARKSALRLRFKLNNENTSELENLIDAACQDPSHSVIQKICDATLIDWVEEAQNWDVLTELLRLISEHLRCLRQHHSL